MSNYRAYIIGQDGHFCDFKVIEAPDDAAAVEVAKAFVDGHDIEVWHLDRKLAVFKSASE